MGVFAALMGLVLISFGVWLLRHMPASKFWHVTVRVLGTLSFIAAMMLIPSNSHKPEKVDDHFAQEWSHDKLIAALNRADPVFVEMTAAWCITCKVNHALAIDIPSTRRLFADNGVEYFVGDWTNQDPEITDYLNSFGRSGVPIYVYYGPRRADETRPDPVILPQILTPGIVAKAVSQE
jgi:thiol:disulfide interchange protein DsbD